MHVIKSLRECRRTALRMHYCSCVYTRVYFFVYIVLASSLMFTNCFIIFLMRKCFLFLRIFHFYTSLTNTDFISFLILSSLSPSFIFLLALVYTHIYICIHIYVFIFHAFPHSPSPIRALIIPLAFRSLSE